MFPQRPHCPAAVAHSSQPFIDCKQASGYCQNTLHPPGRMAHFFAALPARGLDEATADECLGILFKVLTPNRRLGQLFRIPSLSK